MLTIILWDCLGPCFLTFCITVIIFVVLDHVFSPTKSFEQAIKERDDKINRLELTIKQDEQIIGDLKTKKDVEYVDRIVEKKIEVPIEKIVEVPKEVSVEKEVIKYVDRIVEVPVDFTQKEKERIIEEGKRRAEEIVFEAELDAEKILADAKESAKKEVKARIEQAEQRALRITAEAQDEIMDIKRTAQNEIEKAQAKQATLDAWYDELKEKDRKTTYNFTRSENHRKAALELKHEAQEIRDDMLKQGTEYLSDLCDRVGRLMDFTRIDDETILESVSQELNERRKAHRQNMKNNVMQFADANFHNLKYDSQKVCLLAIHYCDDLTNL